MQGPHPQACSAAPTTRVMASAACACTVSDCWFTTMRPSTTCTCSRGVGVGVGSGGGVFTTGGGPQEGRRSIE